MKSACLKVGLLLTFFLTSLFTWSQNKRISGRVVSEEDNKPLAGVSVSIKGRNIGTQTNADGIYTLDAAGSDVLVFSYSGFTSFEIPVGNSSSVDVSLAPGTGKMDEV